MVVNKNSCGYHLLLSPFPFAMLQSLLFLPPNLSLTLSQLQHRSAFLSSSSTSCLPNNPSTYISLRPHNQVRPKPCFAQFPEPTTTITTPTPVEDDGPIELPPSTSIFATTDDPTPLQIATSVLLTGAISVFLFRSVRRRIRRSKEMKFRSTGAKSIKDEALENLKAMKLPVDDPSKPPSPAQALLGGIAAGVITLILYKFATTVEAGLNRQTISDNFSVRQITITIRTIINGICYLATFVFGINAVGLTLYSGQLALNSFMEGSSNKENSGNEEGNTGKDSTTDSKESSSSDEDSEKNQ